MIDKDKVYAYFNKYHGPILPSTNGWNEAVCPFCGKRKLAIHFDYLVTKCWKGCFKGFAMDLIKDYHGITYFEAVELVDSQDPGLARIPTSIVRAKEAAMILPLGYTPILSGDGTLGERARNYLRGRGFDLNYLDRIGIGYCIEQDPIAKDNYFGYIIIPFKKKGILVYFIGRDYIDNFPRYKNPAKEKYGIGKAELFFNEEALYLQDRVYITEGWACAATLGQEGISIQGSIPSTIQKNIIIKSDVKEVVIIPDAGYYLQGLQAARDLVTHKRVKVVNLDPFLTSEGKKDVNEIGKELVVQLADTIPYLDMGKLYKELKAYS